VLEPVLGVVVLVEVELGAVCDPPVDVVLGLVVVVVVVLLVPVAALVPGLSQTLGKLAHIETPDSC